MKHHCLCLLHFVHIASKKGSKIPYRMRSRGSTGDLTVVTPSCSGQGYPAGSYGLYTDYQKQTSERNRLPSPSPPLIADVLSHEISQIQRKTLPTSSTSTFKNETAPSRKVSAGTFSEISSPSLSRPVSGVDQAPNRSYGDTSQLFQLPSTSARSLPSRTTQQSDPLETLPTLHSDLVSCTTVVPSSTPFGRVSDRLDAFLDGRTSYTDAEIMDISFLLKLTKTGADWSKVPRTYIVLRIIGQLEVLDKFIEQGFSDQWFPVVTRGLPQVLQASCRQEFVTVQERVLTKSIDIEKAKEVAIGILLKASAFLSRVEKFSGREVLAKWIAWKTIFGLKTDAATKQFSDEVSVLKRLNYRHMVVFIGSYTDLKYLALIMSPIAEMNLDRYLQTMPHTKAPGLRTFFGCLATGLHYLHDNQIRHKNIQPGNVLVDNGNVLFTDFGLARDSTDATGSTTAGASSLTPRYCAPEVANWEPRNSTFDVWSLGCVFLEMAAVLKGLSISEFRSYCLDEKNGNGLPFVRTNMEAIEKLTTELESRGLHSDNRALHWMRKMCKPDRFARTTAAQLVQLITVSNDFGETNGGFCGICCLHGEESDIGTGDENDLDGMLEDR